jgi:hypothetical protein
VKERDGTPETGTGHVRSAWDGDARNKVAGSATLLLPAEDGRGAPLMSVATLLAQGHCSSRNRRNLEPIAGD